jgi:hypothetical protein
MCLVWTRANYPYASSARVSSGFEDNRHTMLCLLLVSKPFQTLHVQKDSRYNVYILPRRLLRNSISEPLRSRFNAPRRRHRSNNDLNPLLRQRIRNPPPVLYPGQKATGESEFVEA